MTGPDEVEQFISADHGVRGDLRAHQPTIPPLARWQERRAELVYENYYGLAAAAQGGR
jgi:hypothetical protein